MYTLINVFATPATAVNIDTNVKMLTLLEKNKIINLKQRRKRR